MQACLTICFWPWHHDMDLEREKGKIILENRTPEEEMAYRRYLRKRIRMRKRRRQVMIARTIVALVGVILVFFIFYGIGKMTGPIKGDSGKKADATEEPKVTPLVVDVPNGYQGVYDKLYGMREENPEINDILINLGKYPVELLTLLSNNTETLSFVSDYLMHVDDEEKSGGITGEELTGSIPLFQQWDKRWGYLKYGSNIIAINGCGPTCMSMVYTGLTGNTDKDPAVIADFCLENNYYTEDSGTAWSLMLNGAKKLGLDAEKISIGKESIKEKLDSGQPVICSMKPGDFTDTGHFIVLCGITEDGKLMLNDPNNISRSEKKWDMDTVLSQIKAAWSYSYTIQ